MTQTEWESAHSNGSFHGAGDVSRPARYFTLAGILRNSQSVLDVGCGTGLLRGFIDCDYTGIDLSFVAIKEARSRHSGEFICDNADTWKCSRKFDAVVLNEVLYYLPESALSKYAGMVADGGLLVISIFNKHAPLWRSNPNMKALHFAEAFLLGARRLDVVQDGHKWTILFSHVQ